MHMQIFNRISFVEKVLLTKHLAIMIKSGILISEALATLISQTKSKTLRSILSNVLSEIQNGQSLSKSLARHPQVFDQFYVSIIEVGEASGTLESNLEFLAKQLAKDYAMRKKVQGAMLYPGLIFCSVGVMGGFISLFILPQLVDFFGAFQIELPLPTRLLLGLAKIMKQYGIAIVSGGLSLFFFFLYWSGTAFGKPIWHRALLFFPIVGTVTTAINLARFSRNFGTMLRSGVTLITCLRTTANTLDNVIFRKIFFSAEASVKNGKQLSDTLAAYSVIPPMMTKMIAVGEKTGKLDEVLLYLGDYYEEEVDEFSRNLSTILEPVLLIGIGIVVGFVAIAIISPIYELTGSF